MQGEFRVDATRDTFNPNKHFYRALAQQGRVWLEADWNEQTNILLHYLQMLGADLIGPHAGTNDNDFKIIFDDELKSDFLINAGHYYVNGLLCELEPVEIEIVEFPAKNQVKVGAWSAQHFLLQKNQWLYLIDQKSSQPILKKLVRLVKVEPAKQLLTLDLEDETWKKLFDDKVEGETLKISLPLAYTAQPDYSAEKLKDDTYLIYLDVWERHVTFIEDESDITPGIREVALGGPDTTTRSKLVWQVKVKPVEKVVEGQKPFQDYSNFLQALSQPDGYPGTGTGRIKARAKQSAIDNTDPCIIAPNARYRGTQNQLYRVEIHEGGKVGDATFKWSRENSSVVFPLLTPVQVGTSETVTVTLAHLGWDDRLSLSEKNWVELVDDDHSLQNLAEPLFQVTAIERGIDFRLTLTRTQKTASTVGQDLTKHPYLRRWDQKGDMAIGGVLKVVEQTNDWTSLEAGIQIQFQPAAQNNQKKIYRNGDYWLMPARTATGVEWLGSSDNPAAQLPHGVQHHYAPLAVISVADGIPTPKYDCRRKLKQNWENVEQ